MSYETDTRHLMARIDKLRKTIGSTIRDWTIEEHPLEDGDIVLLDNVDSTEQCDNATGMLIEQRGINYNDKTDSFRFAATGQLVNIDDEPIEGTEGVWISPEGVNG